MTFNPARWHPIAIGFSALNLAAGGFALGTAEPLHAAVHGAVALAAGLWARRLRQARPDDGDRQSQLDMLETEVNQLRGELSETQERLDFTERMLAQGVESRRMGPER
ncbi:MAG TPA: hypothetical protein VG500_04075 [Gemmatimonadales bacterium]|jgi:hypothetical protein|nr:hypothetical protein [Gemmatimonadales bacterium]